MCCIQEKFIFPIGIEYCNDYCVLCKGRRKKHLPFANLSAKGGLPPVHKVGKVVFLDAVKQPPPPKKNVIKVSVVRKWRTKVVFTPTLNCC